MTMFRRFFADKSAATAVVYGLMAMPLCGAAALSVDVGRVYLAESRLQSALDNAALAAGSSNVPESQLSDFARRFMLASYPNTLGELGPVTVDENNNRLTLSATARVPMTFAAVVGYNDMTVRADTEVLRANAALMVSLVLDNTGSMWSNNNIGALRTATGDLIADLFGPDRAEEMVRVAIVPYGATVNVGPAAEAIVNPHGFGPVTQANPLGWKGCVFERMGVHSIADSNVNAGGSWDAYRWAPSVDNVWVEGNAASVDPGPRNTNGLTGPNLGCGTPIVPLTNDRSRLNNAVATMTAWNRGGTLTDIGMAWGIRTLSPGAPFTESNETDPITNQPLWSSDRWRKAIVLMTDGESQFFDLSGSAGPNNTHPGGSDITGYGRLGEARATSILNTSNASTARDRLNQRIEQLCTEAKEQGITVYTVVFTSGVGQGVRDMYMRCASDPGKYWYAPNQGDLSRAFDQIGTELSRLRVAR